MSTKNQSCKTSDTSKTFNGKLILRNDFHGTEAVVVVKDGIVFNPSLKRARAKLCGMSDCQCGGIRGVQDVVIDSRWFNGKEYLLIANK